MATCAARGATSMGAEKDVSAAAAAAAAAEDGGGPGGGAAARSEARRDEDDDNDGGRAGAKAAEPKAAEPKAAEPRRDGGADMATRTRPTSVDARCSPQNVRDAHYGS